MYSLFLLDQFFVLMMSDGSSVLQMHERRYSNLLPQLLLQ